MPLHRIEVPILMKKCMTALDAKRTDDEIHGLSHGDTQTSQLSIVSGGGNREIDVHHRRQREHPQMVFNDRRVRLVPCALQQFEQNKIPDENRPGTRKPLQSPNGWRVLFPEKADPDG